MLRLLENPAISQEPPPGRRFRVDPIPRKPGGLQKKHASTCRANRPNFTGGTEGPSKEEKQRVYKIYPYLFPIMTTYSSKIIHFFKVYTCFFQKVEFGPKTQQTPANENTLRTKCVSQSFVIFFTLGDRTN